MRQRRRSRDTSADGLSGGAPVARRARARVVVALLLALALAGCDTAPAQPAGTPAPATAALASPAAQLEAPDCLDAAGPLAGEVVFASQGSLLAVGADGSGQATLLAAPAGLALADPAWSPDGQTLAYALLYPNPIKDLAWFQLSRLCGLDRATGKGRVLVAGGEQTALEHPTWAPDGKAILATLRRYRFDQAGAPLGEFLAIASFDLASGAETTLVENGRFPALSPDGSQLAYAQISPQDYAMTLMVADARGQGARPLYAPRNPLATVQEPRWSPDGSRVAFTLSADEQPSGGAPEPAGERSLLDRLLGVSVARAHGVHAFIWLIGSDGTGLTRLSPAWVDEPRIAWEAGGQRLAYTSAAGALVALDLAGGQPRTLVGQGAYGGLAWR